MFSNSRIPILLFVSSFALCCDGIRAQDAPISDPADRAENASAKIEALEVSLNKRSVKKILMQERGHLRHFISIDDAQWDLSLIHI